MTILPCSAVENVKFVKLFDQRLGPHALAQST